MCVPVMWDMDMRIEGDGAVCVKVEGHERKRRTRQIHLATLYDIPRKKNEDKEKRQRIDGEK